MTTFYIKNGKRYKAVAEGEYYNYDPKPFGFHLVEVKPGSVSWKFRIDPNVADVESAMKIAKDAMLNKMIQLNQMKVVTSVYPEELQEKAIKAFQAWKDIMGSDIPIQFEGVSMNDVVEAGLNALRDKMLTEKEKE